MAELSELDLYRRMTHHLQEAENCARGLGQARSDVRWTAIAGGMAKMRHAVTQLATGRAIRHGENIGLLTQREGMAAHRAAQQRRAERVAAADAAFRRGE